MSRLFEGFPGNHLNSVWLEGRVMGSPQEIISSRGVTWRFWILHSEASSKKALGEFQIEAPVWAFTLITVDELEGKTVRIIGRLHQVSVRPSEWEDIIYGECVEPLARPPI